MKILNGFHCCYNLKNITLPQNTQLIGENAFVNCTKLKSINIPTGCWCISERAFMGCESLENVYIPATVELVSDFAFAGCKNLTITFIEDDKIYLQDFIEQQEKIKSQNTTDVDYLEEDYFKSTEEIKISDEDKQNLYDDLGIRYRKINIAGKEILWTSGKIIIKPNSLYGVKEVVVYSQEMLEKVINSGYDGKITIISIDKNQKITFDFNVIKQYKNQKSQTEIDDDLEK